MRIKYGKRGFVLRVLATSLILVLWLKLSLNPEFAKDEQDHCALAVTCLHDGAAVYGIAPDNRTARLFLDTCDVHEYNCDHKTNYRSCVEPPITDGDNLKDTMIMKMRLSKLLHQPRWTTTTRPIQKVKIRTIKKKN